MKITDLLNETHASLTANKARTALTMLGIVIGIGSVIAMISVGQGAQGSIEARINALGSNLLLVEPGATRGVGTTVSAGRGSATTLTLEDSDAIAQSVTNVSAVAPEASRRFQVAARGTNTNTQVTGTVPAYLDVRNVQVADGSFFTDAQVQSGARVAILGPTTRDDLFGAGSEAVGETIRINSTEFTVIGVTVAKGGTGFGSQDDMIYVPITTAQRYLTGGDTVTTISVQATDQQAMTQVQQDVTSLLLDRHHITDPTLADFSVLNQEDIVATATSVTGTFTLLLGAIAGISLLVGGIGLMNMMLTTVTERTREIGLRKAIGAKRTDIAMQFLAESVALTVIGGVTGIALGWIGASLISSIGGVTTAVSGSSIILAFGVSAAIGVAFGYYPARRASALNPIEALRYE